MSRTGTITCCIPHCTTAVKFRHSSFYNVRPEWINLIVNYVRKRIQKDYVFPHKLKNICGWHYKILGVSRRCSAKDVVYPAEPPIHFPHLGISVSKFSRTGDHGDQLQVRRKCVRIHELLDTDCQEIYSSEDIGVGSEVAYPRTEEEPGIELKNNDKKYSKTKMLKNYDHTYSIRDEHLRALVDDYEKTKEENEFQADRIRYLTEHYAREMKTLKESNEALVKKNMEAESNKTEPLLNIFNNASMLNFYTGFPTCENYRRFSNMLKHKHLTTEIVEELGKFKISFEQQLVLILARLRLGLLLQDLSFRFNITTWAVTRISLFWMDFLSNHLAKESLKLNRGGNQQFILECHETFIETENTQGANVVLMNSKTYVPAKGLIEIGSNGVVSYVSNLSTDKKELIVLWKSQFSSDKNRVQPHERGVKENIREDGLQTLLKKNLYLIKGFRILKGTFPNPLCQMSQLNCYWKICCFLVNFIQKPLLKDIE